MSFPAEVRAEMGRQNIKPQEIADRAGLSPSQVSRKITTEQRSLDIDEAILIGDALGVPAWELLRRATQTRVPGGDVA
nr:MAG TPA: Helix-turn-helix XRE-family like protein [Bacteriophage sp.]